jgi:hypothetical protein
LSDLTLTMQGQVVRVASDSRALLEQIRRDFACFVTAPTDRVADLTLVHAAVSPQAVRGGCPPLVATGATPRYAAFDAGQERWIDYYRGRALVRWRRDREVCELWCVEPSLSHELAYLLILSRVGERLDARGWHRLHAGAVAFGGRALLLVGPSGAGKTTLTLAAARRPGAALLSDDMPLVARTGRIAAWPSRLGLTQPPADVPERAVRAFDRADLGRKWLVDVAALGVPVGAEAHPAVLVFAARRLSGASRIRRVNRLAALRGLFGPLVAGVGVPQLVEYFLGAGIGELIRKVPLVLSRSAAASALAARSACFRLECGPDLEETLAVWRRFLDEEGALAPSRPPDMEPQQQQVGEERAEERPVPAFAQPRPQHGDGERRAEQHAEQPRMHDPSAREPARPAEAR